MKPLGPAPDPSPDRELPSDIRFRMWLLDLDPALVLRDLEGRATPKERVYFSDAREQKLYKYR